MAQKEYKFLVVYLLERITDASIYVWGADGEEKQMQYLFDYLNKKGQDGWYFMSESRHKGAIYLQKTIGENVKYEYQVIHYIEEKTGGSLFVQRVNEYKLKENKLLADYLNKMGEKGFYLRGELRHQLCCIIERKK